MYPSRSKAFVLRTMSVYLAASLPLWAEPSVADPEVRAEATERVLDKILAKEGISVGGVFSSQYLHSSIGGAGAISSLRSEESLEHTSVDIDLRARPNTSTQGRLVFRMHQDWRNFFSDIGNPINSRWISIDGNMHGMFRYNAGDFRQKYSALTLYSPDIEIMYEPYLAAARRKAASDEVFLGNNDRLLQGVNMNFDAMVEKDGKGLLRDLHINALGARLRNVETSVQNGSKPTAFTERSLVEKFLASTNLDMTLPAGVSLGGSYLRLFDKEGSYSGTGNSDTASQNTAIWAARAGFEMAPLMQAENWTLGLAIEYAASKDDSNYRLPAPDSLLHSLTTDGSALLATLQGGWKTGTTFGFQGELGFLLNDADYKNEMAQSPSFVGERIMNIENDTSKIRTNDVRARNYSTFDALYRQSFKFAPSEATNLWNKAPFQKLSYTNTIMTQSEMAAFSGLRADPALQLIMPFGPATPNRTGLRADLTFSGWDKRIEVKTLLAQLDQVTGIRVDSVRILPKTHYTQAGGGLKLEVGSMIGFAYPITLSGSLVRSNAKNDGIAGDTISVSHEVTSDFINASARIQIWKRFAVLGAYQQIKNTMLTRAIESIQTQDNMGGGIEYKVAAGAYLTATLDRLSVGYSGALSPSVDFHQLQTDLYLSVHF